MSFKKQIFFLCFYFNFITCQSPINRNVAFNNGLHWFKIFRKLQSNWIIFQQFSDVNNDLNDCKHFHSFGSNIRQFIKVSNSNETNFSLEFYVIGAMDCHIVLSSSGANVYGNNSDYHLRKR